MAEKKNESGVKSRYFIFHILITFLMLCLFLLLWQWDLWPAVLAITASHLIVDAVKSSLTKTKWYGKKPESWELWIFLADQLVHLIVILFIWLSLTNQFPVFAEKIAIAFQNTKLWWWFLAYILLTVPVSVLVGKITRRWSKQVERMEQEIKGLLYAGKWIGILERLLIFTFIVAGEFSGVGFLLAAKSVFRFGDLKNSSDHMKTEYIILGTLLSFSIAIFSGLMVKYFVM